MSMHLCSSVQLNMLPNQIVNIVGPKPENAKAGVGENLTRRPATEDGFQAIFEAPKFLQNRVFEAPRLASTKTLVVGLKNVFRDYSVRDSQNFPSGDPLENSFQRVSRNGFQGPSSQSFALRLPVAPPLALPPSLRVIGSFRYSHGVVLRLATTESLGNPSH